MIWGPSEQNIRFVLTKRESFELWVLSIALIVLGFGSAYVLMYSDLSTLDVLFHFHEQNGV